MCTKSETGESYTIIYSGQQDTHKHLQAEVATVPQHDMLLVMGDMNAKVGSDNTDRERAMGSQGCGTTTNNGERLVNFCLNNNLCDRWDHLPIQRNESHLMGKQSTKLIM